MSAYFESLRSADGVARMRLRVPVTGFPAALGLSLDREVIVEAARGRHRRDLMHITWAPEGKAVFPKFEGTLVVWAGEDGKESYIELEGKYEPPFDGAGRIFDEVIGRRLAELTAREFLDDLKRAIEFPTQPRP